MLEPKIPPEKTQIRARNVEKPIEANVERAKVTGKMVRKIKVRKIRMRKIR